MEKQYSTEIPQVIKVSREEAARAHAYKVAPEHLLLAILKEGSESVFAYFKEKNIDSQNIMREIEKIIEGQSHIGYLQPQDIILDNTVMELCQKAVMECIKSKQAKVQSIHLLMAFFKSTKTKAIQEVLKDNHITYASIVNFIYPADMNEYRESVINKYDEDDPESSEEKDNMDLIDAIASNLASTLDGLSLPDEMNEDEDDEEYPIGDDDSTDNMAEQKAAHVSKKTATTAKRKSKTPILDHFSIDLTEKAQDGELDPMVGRENEIQRLMEILGRRKKNNPILIGEPGVGKSAIVEGLAQLINNQQASPFLYNKRLVNLDLTAIVAGTKYRGQFEERLKGLMKELEENPDIIVFIDEIHTIIGAGGAQGSMDVANILKPALARGTIQCIGATTLKEYRNSIEKDGALERRFQRIIVNPNTPEETLQILKNIKEKYEQHHAVSYSDEVLETCVKLTDRYVSDRFFPDKAIDVLDEVGSRKHLAAMTVPPYFATIQKKIEEIRAKKLQAVGNQNFELAASLRDKETAETEAFETMKRTWAEQGSKSTRKPVSVKDVEDVVSHMTGIPVQKMAESESSRLKKMSAILKDCVIAQDDAINKIVKAIQRNRVGLKAPNHPIGAFMFLGPTGVGKTYLAKKLAEEMFGSDEALIRMDMSEYSESFNTSRLVGAPPGYVGYDEGGQLTEKVHRRPYSIVLLDEIEKANSKVYDMLLQVLDEGRLTDGNGRLIDFRNTIIIMTSNAGTRQLKDFGKGVGFNAGNTTNAIMNERDKEYARSIIQKSLSKQFSPEFLNRLDEIITFDQLGLDAIKRIIDLELKGLVKRIEDMGYFFEISDAAKEFVAKKGYDVQFGARPLKRAIQTYIEDGICELLLDDTLKKGETIHVDKNPEKEELVFKASAENEEDSEEREDTK